MSKPDLTRREFLKTSGTAGAGLVIAFHVPMGKELLGATRKDLEPNAWIRIDPEGLIHVIYDDHEMGQGSSISSWYRGKLKRFTGIGLGALLPNNSQP